MIEEVQYSMITNPQIAPSEKEATFIQKIGSIDRIIHIDLTTDKLQTWFEGQAISQIKWSPDGQSIAFLMKKKGAPQLFTIDRQQVIKQITNVAQGIERYEWGPGGEWLWLAVKGSYTILKHSVTTPQIDNFMPAKQQKLLAVSHNGQQLIVEDAVEHALYIVDTARETRQCIDRTRQHIRHVAFSFSDQYISYVGQETTCGAATFPAVFVYDQVLNTTQNVTEMLDAPVGDYSVTERPTWQQIAWTETDALYFPLSVMGDVRLYYADLYGSIFPASPEEEHIMDFSMARSGNWGIAVISNPIMPERLAFLDITTGERRYLTPAQPVHASSLPEPFSVTTDMGTMYAWMMKPTIEEGQTYPLTIIISPPQKMHTNTWQPHYQSRVMQNQAVIYINNRGSFGYNQLFAQPAENPLEDIQAAIVFIQLQWPWIDREKITLVDGNGREMKFEA